MELTKNSTSLTGSFSDILKSGIIGKVKKLKGATGVMMDDWLSGILSAVILFVLYLFGL